MNAKETLTYSEKIDALLAEDSGLDCAGRALVMILRDYRPLLPAADSEYNRTSRDFVDILEDITPIALDDVAAIMIHLGYELYNSGINGFEWSITPAATGL